jgi:hypothetical protein
MRRGAVPASRQIARWSSPQDSLHGTFAQSSAIRMRAAPFDPILSLLKRKEKNEWDSYARE